MASTAQKRVWWDAWRCASLKMDRVAFPGDGRTWNLLVADSSVPAWQIFADLMQKHDYLFLETAGGTYNCRRITGGTGYSLHAYGIALDINPSQNPYGTTRHNFPQPFIDDVLDTGLFRWGIEFDDPMHWEIDVPPWKVLELTEENMPLNAEDLAAIRQAIREEAAAAVWNPGKNPDGSYYYTINGKHPNTILRAIATDAAATRFAVAGFEGDLDEAVDELIEIIPEEVLDRLYQRLAPGPA